LINAGRGSLDSHASPPDTGCILASTLSMPRAKRPTKVTLKAALLLSGVLTVVFLISFVFSEQGISELQRSRGRVQSLENDILLLKTENARLAREIESLRRSTFAVEKIAREDLGMSRPDEIVYLLQPERNNAP